MTCNTCIYSVRDRRLCLHPESVGFSFWSQADNCRCHSPKTDVPETDFGNIETEKEPVQLKLFA